MKLIRIADIYDEQGEFLTCTRGLSQAVMWCDMNGKDNAIYKVQTSDGEYLVHVGPDTWTEQVA